MEVEREQRASQIRPSDEIVAAMIQLYSSYSETTEDVVGRRIAFTQWSNSICFAICAGIGIVGSWGMEHPTHLLEASVVCFGLCAFGFLYSTFWSSQFRMYRDLAGARYQVLQGFASRLSQAAPFFFDPHRAEFEGALARLPKGFRLAPSPTAERVMPPLFQILFLLVIPLCIGVILARDVWGISIPSALGLR